MPVLEFEFSITGRKPLVLEDFLLIHTFIAIGDVCHLGNFIIKTLDMTKLLLKGIRCSNSFLEAFDLLFQLDDFAVCCTKLNLLFKKGFPQIHRYISNLQII